MNTRKDVWQMLAIRISSTSFPILHPMCLTIQAKNNSEKYLDSEFKEGFGADFECDSDEARSIEIYG